MTVMVPNHITWNLELFLLGFDNHSKIFKLKEETGLKIEFSKTENLFSVYNKLATTAKDQPHFLPHAILMNSDLLKKEDNILFLKSLRENKNLKDIPLIAVSQSEKDQPDCKFLIQLGIDDHYVGPIEESVLEKRIDFLNQFKSKYGDILKKENNLPEYKVPLPKRFFDIVVSATLILFLSPLLLLIAALIRIESRGNIIYKSKRIGTGYKTFFFLKFRSMYPDADKRLAEIQHLNKYSKNGSEGAAFMKFENDPRITKIGKFIRKTSFDELPQLFNVLRGEMSIVGNRPLPIYEAEQLTKDQWAKRFFAPAGITGLWQVSPEGKDTMTVEQRIGLDIEYANNYSLVKDLQILAKTPFAMIQKGE